MLRKTIFVVVVGLFAGCGAFPAAAVAVPMCAEPRQDVAGLLRYAEHIRGLDAAAQQTEFELAQMTFTHSDDVVDRFSLVMLLMLPKAPFRNDAEARSLLEQFLDREEGARDYRHLAEFLMRVINERSTAEQAMEVARRQHQLLRKQVEELKAIEREMNQQGKTGESEPQL